MTIRSFCRIAIEVGAKIWFVGERGGYTVRAVGKRYLVCTKPFNLPVAKHQQQIQYTVVDTQGGIRGRENLIFGMGCSTDEECKWMLRRLEMGESGVSRRNCVLTKVRDISFVSFTCIAAHEPLLTAAAKFLGMEGSCDGSESFCYLDKKGKAQYWCPLHNSTQALALLASQKFQLSFGVSSVSVKSSDGAWSLHMELLCDAEDYIQEATRRAIVMLVAEMQRAKDQQNS